MKRLLSLIMILFAAVNVFAADIGDKHRSDEPLYRIVLNKKYGFVDRTGTIVIQPQFSYAENFSEGFAKFR